MDFEKLYAKYKLEGKSQYVSVELLRNEEDDAFLDRLASFLVDSCEVLEFRGSNLTTKRFVKLAKKVRQLCAQFGVIFIIGERVDVAFVVQADGICVDKNGFPIEEIRDILGKSSLIGFRYEDYIPEKGVDFLVTKGSKFSSELPIFVENIKKC